MSPESIAPPSRLFLLSDAVRERLASAVRLEQLAIETDPAELVGLPASTAQTQHIACQPVSEFSGRVPDWIAEVKRARDQQELVVFVAASAGRAERMLEIARDYQIIAAPAERAEDAHTAALIVAVGRLSRGFRLPGAPLSIYVETDVFDEDRRAPEAAAGARRPRRFSRISATSRSATTSCTSTTASARSSGLKQITLGAGEPQQEFMELRYAGDDKLFVPVERLDLVQKYTGAARPPLDKLGGTTWEKAKTRVKKAMRDMAEELLKLYAARKARPPGTPCRRHCTGSRSSRTPSRTS